MNLEQHIPKGSQAPRWLQKIQYTRNAIAYLESTGQRYGEIFNAPIIGHHSTVLLVSNPQALQRIFTSDPKQITMPPNPLLQPLAGDYSIFTLEGSRHRRERRLLMPPFHSERMRANEHLMTELAKRAIYALLIDQPFSAHQFAQDISLSVILKVVFGINQAERFSQLKTRMIKLSEALRSPFMGGLLFFPSLQKDWGVRSPWGYVQHLKRQISELIYAEIRDRRQSSPSSDVLSLLMSAQDESGQPMNDVELHDQLITLLIAGHETTSSAIAWALYQIHRHPSVHQALQAELAQFHSFSAPHSVAQLPYLTAVCNETLRLCPVAILTVPREVKEPIELMHYQIQPGTRLYGCIYLTHQRPDLYPEPHQFKPERFLERQFSAYEFLPFGGGARRCIGEALALSEMKIVIATMLSQARFALVDSAKELPQRRGVVFTPARGVQMILKERF